MKKKLNIFFLLIYINTLLISEGFSGIELIANRNAKAWDIQHSILADDNYSIQLNKNDVVKGIRTAHIIYDDSYTGEYKLINGFYSEILIKDKKYYIRTDNIIQKKSEGRLPEKIITRNDGTFYVPLYFIESFSKLNKDILINQEKAFKYLNDWFLRDNEHFNGALNLFQTSISFEHLLQYGFWIEKVKFDKEIYQINIKRDIDCYDNYDIEDLGWTNEVTAKLPFYTNDNNIIFLKIDGDYIILSDSQLFKSKFIYCKINKKTIREFVKFLNDEYYDYSSISWPRHADGSCDYDGSKKAHTPTKPAAISSTPTTNVAPNKTMSVKENLKLRSGEATTTSVLAVLSAGTKVKILALGKQATIDGITNNWVQVEVQAGAKDRDGNAIAAGTTGWCFGGCLTER